MGELLLRYYKYVSDMLGLQGKIQLAQATKVPSIDAAMAEDTPERIKLFRDTIAKITGKPSPF